VFPLVLHVLFQEKEEQPEGRTPQDGTSVQQTGVVIAPVKVNQVLVLV
jgi:hypothetical protein